jgi:Zn-dependent metalloprotease
MKTTIIFLFFIITCSTLLAQSKNIIKIDPAFNKKIEIQNVERNNSLSLLNDLIDKNTSFVKIKVNTTLGKNNIGHTIHEKYQQYYKGIKVEDGIFISHSINEKLVNINGNFVQTSNIIGTPLLTNNEALEIAKKYVNAERYVWESSGDNIFLIFETKTSPPEGELVIINDSLGNLKWTYKFLIETLIPLDSKLIYIDASNGEIIRNKSFMCNADNPATAVTRYSGQKIIYTNYTTLYGYFLYNTTNFGKNYVYNSNNQYTYPSTRFYDLDNNWTASEWDNDEMDNIALDISWACWNVKSFLHNIIGIDSYNNLSGDLKCWVHFSTNYAGASSWPYNDGMRFGDGDSTTDPWGSLDIVAHEIGHKMIYWALNSIDINDGALKEGFYDIFAIGAKNYIAPEKSIWTFGEEICLNHNYLRSWSNPKLAGREGPHADTYGGQNWSGNEYQKSTVLSHWFYIFNEGKTGTNDIGNSYDVEGINNINESTLIVYNVLNNHLSHTSTFQDVKEQSIEYIQNTYGDVSEESLNAMQAWYAVGVPGDCNVNIENKTINNSSVYVDLDVGDCKIDFSNVSFSNGTNAKYNAGEVTIDSDFEVPTGVTLTIN